MKNDKMKSILLVINTMPIKISRTPEIRFIPPIYLPVFLMKPTTRWMKNESMKNGIASPRE